VAGQAVSLALRNVVATEVRKGMALVPINLQVACKGFEAQVSLLGQRYPITESAFLLFFRICFSFVVHIYK